MLPFEENNAVPLAWSCKRTVKRMRRMGIIPPLDNARIDHIANAFVSNSISETPVEETHDTTLSGSPSNNMHKTTGASIGNRSTAELLLESKVGGSSNSEGDYVHKTATVHEFSTCNAVVTTEAGDAHQVTDSATVARGNDGCGVSTLAVPLHQTNVSELVVRNDEVWQERMKTTSVTQDIVTEGSSTKEEMYGANTAGTTVKRGIATDGVFKCDNRDKNTMVMSEPYIIGNDGKSDVLVHTEVEDIGYDGDTESSIILDGNLLGSRLPPSKENICSPNQSESFSYPSRLNKRSDFFAHKNGKEQMTQANLGQSIAKLSIGETRKGYGTNVRRGEDSIMSIEQDVASLDISPKGENRDGTSNVPVDVEGQESACRTDSKTCECCCAKALDSAE